MNKVQMMVNLSLLTSCLMSCGSSDLDEVADGGSLTSATSEEPQYRDEDAHMSSDGQKIVFASERLNSDGTDIGRKIYRYDVTQDASTQPQRLTSVSSTYGEEIKAKVSPDGTMVAFISRDESGVYHLYVQNWDGTIVGEVSAPSNLIRYDDLEFASDSSGIAYVALVEQGDEEQYYSYYSKVTLASSFSFDQVVTGSNEWGAKLRTVSGTKYLVTQTLTDSFVTKFKTYSINDTSTPVLSLVQTSGDLSAVDGRFISVGEAGIYFRQPLTTARSKERLGDLAANEDGSSARSYVKISEGLNSSPLLSSSSPADFATSTNFSGYEHTDVYGVNWLDSNLLAVFGGDYFICTNGSLYLTSIILYNFSTNVALPLVVQNTDDVPSGIVTEACSKFVAGTAAVDQPIERTIVNVSIQGTVASGFKMLFESKDSGDREIYLLNFKLTSMSSGDDSVLTDENITDISVVQVSKNKSTTD